MNSFSCHNLNQFTNCIHILKCALISFICVCTMRLSIKLYGITMSRLWLDTIKNSFESGSEIIVNLVNYNHFTKYLNYVNVIISVGFVLQFKSTILNYMFFCLKNTYNTIQTSGLKFLGIFYLIFNTIRKKKILFCRPKDISSNM